MLVFAGIGSFFPGRCISTRARTGDASVFLAIFAILALYAFTIDLRRAWISCDSARCPTPRCHRALPAAAAVRRRLPRLMGLSHADGHFVHARPAWARYPHALRASGASTARFSVIGAALMPIVATWLRPAGPWCWHWSPPPTAVALPALSSPVLMPPRAERFGSAAAAASRFSSAGRAP